MECPAYASQLYIFKVYNYSWKFACNTVSMLFFDGNENVSMLIGFFVCVVVI